MTPPPHSCEHLTLILTDPIPVLLLLLNREGLKVGIVPGGVLVVSRVLRLLLHVDVPIVRALATTTLARTRPRALTTLAIARAGTFAVTGAGSLLAVTGA